MHPYLHNRVVHRRRSDWSWDLRSCHYCDLLDYTALLVIMRRKRILNICSSVLARNLSDHFRLETCHCNPFSHHYTDSYCVMPVTVYACTRIYDATGFHGEAMQICPSIPGRGTCPCRGLRPWLAEVGTNVKWWAEEVLHSSLDIGLLKAGPRRCPERRHRSPINAALCPRRIGTRLTHPVRCCYFSLD